MKLIIASDIHGVTAPLRELFQHFDDELTFLSPWETETSPYLNEQEAVAAFHTQHGLKRYQEKIADAAANSPALLLGFSVGATAMWLHIASEQCPPDSRAFLYYGSRIRDHQDCIPHCPTSVIFVEHEASFQPASIIPKLTHPHVLCTILQGTRHGFMNPSLASFDQQISREQLHYLKFACKHNFGYS